MREPIGVSPKKKPILFRQKRRWIYRTAKNITARLRKAIPFCPLEIEAAREYQKTSPLELFEAVRSSDGLRRVFQKKENAEIRFC